MIPKIIHYCWFGGKPIPKDLQDCIDSWSKLEGFTIMRWDESNCSFDENEFVRKTYAEKKLGFIGDYYRLKAVYEYGGVYLDTDVKVCKSFDDLLNHNVFINFIMDCSIGSAIIGSEKGSPFIKKLLNLYDATTFGKTENGKCLEWKGDKLVVNNVLTSNYYYTWYIINNYPNFCFNNKFQDMKDFVIYPKEMFEIGTLSNRHYALHLCAGEWRIKEDTSKTLRGRIKSILSHVPFLYDKVQVLVRKRRYRKLKTINPFYPYYLAQKHHTDLPTY